MKIDMHVHPKAIDKRGRLESCIRDTFLDGIVFTEHLTARTDHKEFIEIYEKTVSICDKYQKMIFSGAELNIKGEDFLLYGVHLMEDVIRCPLDSLDSALEFAHKNGGIIIQAHPFRKCVKKIYTACDGWEFNSREDKLVNYSLCEFARMLNKISTGGSDSHKGGIGAVYTEFEHFTSDLVSDLKHRRYIIEYKG